MFWLKTNFFSSEKYLDLRRRKSAIKRLDCVSNEGIRKENRLWFQSNTTKYFGAWGGVMVKALRLVERSRDRFPVVSLDFSVTYSFRPYNGPGVDSAPSENEYQERFLGVKAAGVWG
jgi:hypothetical protein